MSIENIVEDWDTVKKRWQAWWNCELHDRVLVSVYAPLTKPRDDISPQSGLNVDQETQWTDTDMIRRTLEVIRTTYYGGEAIPWCWNPISVGHALYFGGKPHFAKLSLYSKIIGYMLINGKVLLLWFLHRELVVLNYCPLIERN